MTEDTTEAGTYTGSYTVTDVVVDGTYDLTVTIGAGSDSKTDAGDRQNCTDHCFGGL